MTQLQTTAKGNPANRLVPDTNPEAEAVRVRKAAGACLFPQEVPAAEPAAVTFLELPCPPSVNALWRNVPKRGRVDTPAYRDWKGHAGWYLRQQRPEPVRGRVLIVINIERTSQLADLDNRIKATLDLLVAHGVIDDDRHVSGLAVAWAPPKDALVRLAIMPAAALSLQFQLASDGAHGGWQFPAPQQEPN